MNETYLVDQDLVFMMLGIFGVLALIVAGIVWITHQRGWWS